MFVRKETLELFSSAEIRKLHPEVSFPAPIEAWHVKELGYLPVEQDPLPNLSVGQSVIIGDLRLEDGRFVREWIVVSAGVPSEVTMRQAKLALHFEGLLHQVNTAIQNSEDEVTKIEWQYAQTVKRSWPSLSILAQQIPLTDEDIDNLFILAESL